MRGTVAGSKADGQLAALTAAGGGRFVYGASTCEWPLTPAVYDAAETHWDHRSGHRRTLFADLPPWLAAVTATEAEKCHVCAALRELELLAVNLELL